MNIQCLCTKSNYYIISIFTTSNFIKVTAHLLQSIFTQLHNKHLPILLLGDLDPDKGSDLDPDTDRVSDLDPDRVSNLDPDKVSDLDKVTLTLIK